MPSYRSFRDEKGAGQTNLGYQLLRDCRANGEDVAAHQKVGQTCTPAFLWPLCGFSFASAIVHFDFPRQETKTINEPRVSHLVRFSLEGFESSCFIASQAETNGLVGCRVPVLRLSYLYELARESRLAALLTTMGLLPSVTYLLLPVT